jgi:hypothetical protein
MHRLGRQMNQPGGEGGGEGEEFGGFFFKQCRRSCMSSWGSVRTGRPYDYNFCFGVSRAYRSKSFHSLFPLQ